MSEGFEQLIRRVYEGDPEAAAQIVNDYESEVRRIVRHRLRDRDMQRIIDSTDICQSVFGKFFFYVALGRFQIDNPKDLVKLLTKMATNRVIDKYRKEASQKNLVSQRLPEQKIGDCGEQMDQLESPETIAEYKELLERVRQELSVKELEISRMRADGKTWLEISLEMSESPHALRKRLERACQRIFSELGIVVDE